MSPSILQAVVAPVPAVRGRAIRVPRPPWRRVRVSVGAVAAVVLFAVYATVSIRAHQRLLTTGYDLGIFTQVVRSYAEGGPGVTELKGPGFRQLGDHFSPILVLIAPLYRLWPSPVTLLVVQAALFAVAVLPIAGRAERTHGRVTAVAVAFGYGGSWGIAQALGFDFHEICFAVPCLAFGLTAVAERRMTAGALWTLPLLLVKEDLGLTVAAIGVLIAVLGDRRTGAALAAAGIGGMVLAVTVLIPAVNPHGTYAYRSAAPAVERLFAEPSIKATTVLLLLAPTVLLALRSPVLLVAAPTLLWRFASDNPYYWGTDFHYSAVLMPVASVAFVDALHRPWTGPVPIRHAAVGGALITALLLPRYPLADLARAETWRADPRVSAAHAVLAHIPAGDTVAASNHLVPQLVSGTRVRLFGLPGPWPAPEWIVVDTARPSYPLSAETQGQELDAVRARGYRTVLEQDGYLLLRRPA